MRLFPKPIEMIAVCVGVLAIAANVALSDPKCNKKTVGASTNQCGDDNDCPAISNGTCSGTDFDPSAYPTTCNDGGGATDDCGTVDESQIVCGYRYTCKLSDSGTICIADIGTQSTIKSDTDKVGARNCTANNE